MTDSEKLALIRNMIEDYWNFNSEEQLERGAVCMVAAIYSVVEFGGDEDAE